MDSFKDKNFNNALNCLIYNEKLSKLISETVSNLDCTIHSLKDSQEYLLSQIKCEDEIKSNYICQIINGENMCRVRKPFFSTNNGLIPFTNHVENSRLNDGSNDYYLLKHQMQKLCNEKQLDTLKVAIGKCVHDIKYEQLIRSKDRNSLKQIRTLKLSSLRDLSNECDEEMIGKIDWMTISSQDLKGKISHTDCRRLWEKVFNPQYVYTKWTEIESKTLLQLTSELGCQGKWEQIASRMPTKRQAFVCFKKWLELTSKMETSEEWTSDEDEHLRQVFNHTKDRKSNNKNVNWNKIALLVPNRSAKDCERRWNSHQQTIVTRQFTDDDDYQLLLLIKKIGTENWVDISREMNQRTVEQCQRRYCDIVEELHPWSYLEDRKLWLVLRSSFYQLWQEDNHGIDTKMNITIYKSVINGFNGRCPLVLRHRYVSLCKWFSLWNQFYLTLNVNGQKKAKGSARITSLLSDSCEEKSLVLHKILKIIFRTSFFDRIRSALFSIGSNDPDGDTNQLITQCKSGDTSLLNKLIKESPNKKLMDLLMFIIDLQNGIFIPTKFEDYINRSCIGLKYPDRARDNLRVLSSNVRSFESKTAVSSTLRKSLQSLINDDSVVNSDKTCILKMLECEGKFSSALNFAASTLERTHLFKFVSRIDLLEQFLPQLLRLMVRYVYSQERPELSKTILHSNTMLGNKREQIAELLMYRDSIPSIYKTYLSANKKEGCLSTSYLPRCVVSKLTKEDRLLLCYKNSFKIIKSQQQYPIAEYEILQCANNNVAYITNDLPLLPPNKCSLNLLRAYILQKQTLVNIGKKSFSELIRLRYDNPTKYLQSDLDLPTSLTIDKSSILLCDPKYILLRYRLLSILSIPSIVARISPFACAFAGDKLHEVQNKIKSSTNISDVFNVVNLSQSGSDLEMDVESNCKAINSQNSISRKRKILASVDDDMIPLIEGQPRQIMKISHDQPLTRHAAHTWIKLLAPKSRRAFFVPKDIFQHFLKDNFVIESINGVPVDEFLE